MKPDLVEILKQGREPWNKWRAGGYERIVTLARTDLAGMDLSGYDLSGFTLSHADLRGCNLRGAYLNAADLTQAKLNRATLDGAELPDARLWYTDFSEASLRQAELWKARFFRARLDGADLTEARLRETLFLDVELTKVEGLDACTHDGPSTLDHRTLSKSGRLPLEFLRGVGLSDEAIDRVCTDSDEEAITCFISYSSVDEDFARKLHQDLQASGIRCWFAPKDMRGGRKSNDQIEEAIAECRRLLVILSEASMNSAWVRREIAQGLQRERREGRRVLFPVSIVDFSAVRSWKCFDSDLGLDLAKELRAYHVPSFAPVGDESADRAAFDSIVGELRSA